MWSVGDRVLGQRPEEPYWYPGTIKHSNGERFFVLFDDGEDALLAAEQLLRLQLNVGDPVLVRAAKGRTFTAATIAGKDGDALQIRFQDGGQEWMSAARLRIDRAAQPQPEPVAAPASWSVGDAVLVCWHDLFWYPGVVLSLRKDQAHVVLDDGNQMLTPADQLRPLILEAGDHVQGRWKGGPQYFPGEVAFRNGQVVKINYEDGDEETTLLRLVRLERDDWLPGEDIWTEGDRVLANWFDGNWYPGVVLAVENGKRLQVLFDDGDQALLLPGKIKRLEFQVGDRLFCRRQGGPIFYPGEITYKKGETIRVHYDDGEDETTTIRLVRLEPEGARDGSD